MLQRQRWHTWRFVYRYLLFKPDREELSDKIDEFEGKIGL